MGDALISLIVPTRGRPQGMRAFLESVYTHASAPQNIEVIMIVDEDDPASQAIAFENLRLVKIVVPPGLNMGALNMTGYRAARGKYIMLTNDDARIQTPAWDERTLAVFHSFPDDIVLVHVNDGEAKDQLCVFPFVSRKFCELMNGICPEEYIRYRIDDHIYDVFELLGRLGHKRIVYMPDVSFEHLNVVTDASGKREAILNLDIQSKDTALFYEMMRLRKEKAMSLAGWINERRGRQPDATLSASSTAQGARFLSEGNYLLQRLPPIFERELGRALCVIGLNRRGTAFWNHARSREAGRKPQPVLVDPKRHGFAVFLYRHKYFFIGADELAALGGKLSAAQCEAGAVPKMKVVDTLGEANALVARLKSNAPNAGSAFA
jgi:glycosyltransferase involved in cell wall biosynthesis